MVATEIIPHIDQLKQSPPEANLRLAEEISFRTAPEADDRLVKIAQALYIAKYLVSESYDRPYDEQEIRDYVLFHLGVTTPSTLLGGIIDTAPAEERTVMLNNLKQYAAEMSIDDEATTFQKRRLRLIATLKQNLLWAGSGGRQPNATEVFEHAERILQDSWVKNSTDEAARWQRISARMMLETVETSLSSMFVGKPKERVLGKIPGLLKQTYTYAEQREIELHDPWTRLLLVVRALDSLENPDGLSPETLNGQLTDYFRELLISERLCLPEEDTPIAPEGDDDKESMISQLQTRLAQVSDTADLQKYPYNFRKLIDLAQNRVMAKLESLR